MRVFRTVGRIDRSVGREVAGHVRAPVRHDAYVEFRSAGEVVGRAELDGVLRQDRYRFEATLDLDEDASIDAFLMPDEDGFEGSPFQAVLSPPDPLRDARPRRAGGDYRLANLSGRRPDRNPGGDRDRGDPAG